MTIDWITYNLIVLYLISFNTYECLWISLNSFKFFWYWIEICSVSMRKINVEAKNIGMTYFIRYAPDRHQRQFSLILYSLVTEQWRIHRYNKSNLKYRYRIVININDLVHFYHILFAFLSFLKSPSQQDNNTEM